MRTETTVQLRCTTCGSVVPVRSDESREVVACPSCGSPVVISAYADYLKAFDYITRLIDR